MDVTAARHRLMLVVVGILALAVLTGGLLLWPRGHIAGPATAGQQDGTRLGSLLADAGLEHARLVPKRSRARPARR